MSSSLTEIERDFQSDHRHLTATGEKSGRLRVAVVCFAMRPGLVDYVIGLANALRKENEVFVLTSDNIEPAHSDLLGEATYCFRRSRHLPVDIVKYIWQVIKLRPDCLLMQAWIKWPLLEIPMIWLFRSLGIRCLVTVHDVLPHKCRRWDKWILSRYYPAFDTVIAHSSAAQGALRGMGVDNPIAVIPCAIFDNYQASVMTKQDARTQLAACRQSDFVALFFGHVSKRKGAQQFAESAKHLPPEENIHLVMAGKADLTAHELALLKTECSHNGVTFNEGHVAFEDVQKYFVSADCVVIPYLEGTTSAVLKVAIAFQLPVVATRIGDIPETIDERSGVFIGADDLPKAIAAGILEAKRRSAELASGMHILRSKYTWEAIGAMYTESLHATALAPRLRPR